MGESKEGVCVLVGDGGGVRITSWDVILRAWDHFPKHCW